MFYESVFRFLIVDNNNVLLRKVCLGTTDSIYR